MLFQNKIVIDNYKKNDSYNIIGNIFEHMNKILK